MTRVQSYKREKWTTNGESRREGGFSSLGPGKKKKKEEDEIAQAIQGG